MKNFNVLLTRMLVMTWGIAGFTLPAVAQSSITIPQASQKVQFTQTIGLTDVSLVYHSPAVKGREIAGKIVPMGQVWRAGANENTTISLSHDATIAGEVLSAGIYGLHMMPGESEWAIIFSHNSTSWGSYSYAEKEDALRVQVKPYEGKAVEYLTYSFENRSNDGATLVLAWDKMRIPIRIEVPTTEITLDNIRNELRSTAGFSWMGFQQAANYCLQQETNYEEALGWADQSVAANENFTNLNTQSQLLGKMGREADAAVAKERAMEVASNQELYNYGAQFIGQQQPEKAMEVFQFQAAKYPDTWLSYAGLGAGNRVNGNLKVALTYYEKAKTDAPDQWKAALQKRIEMTQEEAQTAKK